jgi:hypothetical protein
VAVAHLVLVRSMRIALAFLSIGVAIVTVQSAPKPRPDEAKAHGWRMLDTRSRARAYESWFTLEATEAEFRAMQQHHRPSSFAMWTKRLQQLRPGMTEEQVMRVLRPKKLACTLLPHNDIILLSDAYFANVFFDERTKRMISATSPLAITYEIKRQQKPPKT